MGISDKMIAEGKEILTYIPQRQPIVMVDKLINSDEEKTVTGLKITKDNIFCSDSKLTEPGIIEHMAQSAALRAGYESRKGGKEVPLGFIGALKNLNIYNLPPVDGELRTEVYLLNEILNFSIIKSVVKFNNELIADCELKIFLQTN